ncbi:Alpha-N-acetylglucosamine transferase [Faunimonas pinastri]|uniref:Alpha-N-acetylglucosamine transferase n=1 Tax=Faunimonas pinastri TaxID=1855383 RepID=A0A1H9LVQ8_9HYPH|nr:glycosyltransferase family 8 protein [Faunimonas pinastri]SER15275.1 Alpha-N-acetylglucosamine transferase [Faunimonas pinastri]
MEKTSVSTALPPAPGKAGGDVAYATLVTNAEYGMGALALARSLKHTGTQAPLVVLATAEAEGLEALEAEGAMVVPVSQPQLSDGFREKHSREALHRAAPFNKGNKPAFHDPIDNFCKLELWKLDQFRKVVFLDADSLVVKPIDMLFGFPEFSGAPNLYEELADFHRLNSGIFVAEPNRATYDRMIEELDQPGIFWRRTDQTFLQSFFPDWHKLPYIFNTMQYVYFNLPQLWVWESIRVVHYQYEKPWAAVNPKRHLLQPLIDLWWHMHEGGAAPEHLPVLPPQDRQDRTA